MNAIRTVPSSIKCLHVCMYVCCVVHIAFTSLLAMFLMLVYSSHLTRNSMLYYSTVLNVTVRQMLHVLVYACVCVRAFGE